MPKVSVVIPNYNHARFLRQRIESVLQQTYQDFEVILLDDCSTDYSQEILSSYPSNPRLRIEFNAANSGSTFKQWNKGVGLARGEYIWIAESDDYAGRQFLERLVAVLDADPEVVFAYCRSWRVSAEDRLDGFLDRYLNLTDPQRWTSDHSISGRDACCGDFLTSCIVQNASAVLFRKAIYERVGGADETFRMCGDWKMWAAMSLMGRMVYLSEPLNYYRFHDNSVCGRDTLGVVEVEENLRVIRWIQDQVALTDSMRERAGSELGGRWIAPVLSRHVPIQRKRTILRGAMAIDPRALRRLARAMLRMWFWHPVLNGTRSVRHALGLRQERLRSLFK